MPSSLNVIPLEPPVWVRWKCPWCGHDVDVPAGVDGGFCQECLTEEGRQERLARFVGGEWVYPE